MEETVSKSVFFIFILFFFLVIYCVYSLFKIIITPLVFMSASFCSCISPVPQSGCSARLPPLCFTCHSFSHFSRQLQSFLSTQFSFIVSRALLLSLPCSGIPVLPRVSIPPCVELSSTSFCCQFNLPTYFDLQSQAVIKNIRQSNILPCMQPQHAQQNC